MNEALIQNWNSVVKRNDTIYHLGDFAFLNAEKIKAILLRLNGHKHIVLGNHDDALRKLLKQEPSLVDSWHEGVLYKRHNGQFWTLSHYPFLMWLESEKGKSKSIHLHGHQHANKYYDDRAMLDVGVDSAAKILGEYRPFSYEEVMEWITANITKEIVTSKTKQCLSCMEIKSVDDFHIANNNEDGYRNDCKECRHNKKKRAIIQPPYLKCMECKLVKENIPTNFEITDPCTATKLKRRKCIECVKKRQLGQHYKNVYGISWDDVEVLRTAQCAKCAICNRQEKLVVDHNHDTGKIRGLLCSGCNRGIGCMREDVNALRTAAKYLEDNLPLNPHHDL